MSTMTPETKVGHVVTQNPAAARVLERLGLDYCCGGRKSLAAACSDKGLALETVIRELSDIPQSDAEKRWDEASMTELADHIEEAHHRHLRTELPRLAGLIEKVCRAHGDRIPSLFEIRKVFSILAAELLEHMEKEEQLLFPALRAAERGDSSATTDPALIARMIVDHDDAGAALGTLRTLTNDFTPPADACNTYRVMLYVMNELEQDMHQHVHKENNILFPMALRRTRTPAPQDL